MSRRHPTWSGLGKFVQESPISAANIQQGSGLAQAENLNKEVRSHPVTADYRAVHHIDVSSDEEIIPLVQILHTCPPILIERLLHMAAAGARIQPERPEIISPLI